MTVVLSSKSGVPIEDALARGGLSGKNGLYVIGNRISSDRHRRKVGKAYDLAARLSSYVRSYGAKKRTDKSAGALVYYIETVPPRPPDKQGKPLVDVKETFVKQRLGRKVKGRGTEWLEATHETLLAAFAAAPSRTQYKDKRETNRVPTCPKACRARTDGAVTKVEDGTNTRRVSLNSRS